MADRSHLSIGEVNEAFARSGNQAAAEHPEPGDPTETFIDLYAALVSAPAIGRSLLGDAGMVEFVGILDGTDHPEAAQQFIDFMLSRPFQEDLPLTMFVFPVNPEAELPEVFETYAAVPEKPVLMDIDVIDAGRETWIETWTTIVLR